MFPPTYLVADRVAHLGRECEALDRLVGAAVRGGAGDRRARIIDGVERFCADLGINLLDVIECRLRPALRERIDHLDDMAPSMGMRCTCGARISVSLPLTAEDVEQAPDGMEAK